MAIKLIKSIKQFNHPITYPLDEATKMISKPGTCLERYDAESIVCSFVDWDNKYVTEEPTDRLNDEYRIKAMNDFEKVLDAMIRLGNLPNDPALKQMAISTDSRVIDGRTKISFHIVAPYMKTNAKSMPYFIMAADEFNNVEEVNEDGIIVNAREPVSKFIDSSVYPKPGMHPAAFERAFRCVNQAKDWQGSMSRFKILSGSVDQHLIQNTSYAKHLVLAPDEWIADFYMKADIVRSINAEPGVTRNELELLCDAIPASMLKVFSDWNPMMFSICNEAGKLQMKKSDVRTLVHRVSAKAEDEYDSEAVDKEFEKIWKNKNGGSGVGSIIYRVAQTPEGREAVAKMQAARRAEEPCLFVRDDDECDDQFLKVFDDPAATIEQRTVAMLALPLNARKFPYVIVKREFERIHFKIHGGEYGFIKPDGTVDFMDQKKLDQTYRNLFYLDAEAKTTRPMVGKSGNWLLDPLVKTYMNVDFLPPPMQVPVGTYNLFRGMPIQAKRPMRMVDTDDWESVQEKCQRAFQLFNEHLSILVNHNDDDKDYLMTFVAHIFQRPGEKVPRAHVFRSKPGCGKGTLSELLESLLGMYYQYTQGLDGITQQFNASLVAQKLVIIVDEVEIMEHVKVEQKLKSLISEKTAKVEKKYMDAFNIRNMFRIFIFSNEMNPIKITSDDRRYGVFDCSDDRINDADFWDELHALYGDVDVQRYIFDQLMEVDVTKYNFNTPSSIPITKARQELIGHNLAWIDRFVGKMVLDKSAQIKDGVLAITSGKMCELANDADYCKSIGVAPLTRMMNPSAFGKRVKEVKGVTTAPPRDGYARYAVHAETIWKWLSENGDESVPMFQ